MRGYHGVDDDRMRISGNKTITMYGGEARIPKSGKIHKAIYKIQINLVLNCYQETTVKRSFE